MRLVFFAALLGSLAAFVATAWAHHPGADLDKMMGDKERFFQVIDEPAPPFDLADADGNIVRLSDFAGKVLVLNFVFAGCTDVCPLHSALIADVQAKINVTPMQELVQFITVTTDPTVDTSDVLKAYGEQHGLDPRNWMFLTGRSGDQETATRDLARLYDLVFVPLDNGQQMHGVVTHLVDRGGRFAAKFHGLRFDHLNLVLYINGLVNATPPDQPAASGWWQNVKGLFR